MACRRSFVLMRERDDATKMSEADECFFIKFECLNWRSG
jgi:hypothetical protein